MDADRTEGAQQGDAPKQYVTVGEAAKLLGVHRNTVHNRIKAGRLTAHRVVEGEREVYRIERDSLGLGRTSADVHTLDAQRTTAGEELARTIAVRLDEIVRDYTAQLGDVREELGREKERRERAEEERDQLRRELEAARETREGPETVEEAPEGVQQPRPTTAGPQPAAERVSWWRRVFGG